MMRRSGWMSALIGVGMVAVVLAGLSAYWETQQRERSVTDLFKVRARILTEVLERASIYSANVYQELEYSVESRLHDLIAVVDEWDRRGEVTSELLYNLLGPPRYLSVHVYDADGNPVATNLLGATGQVALNHAQVDTSEERPLPRESAADRPRNRPRNQELGEDDTARPTYDGPPGARRPNAPPPGRGRQSGLGAGQGPGRLGLGPGRQGSGPGDGGPPAGGGRRFQIDTMTQSEEVREMVEGIRDEATIGFSKPDIRRQNSPEFYGIGRRRKNGGTIYALVMAAEMHRLQEAASRDALLVNIRQAEGLLGLEWVVLDSQEPPESPEFSWEWDRIDDTTAFVGIRTFRDADGTTAQLRMSIDASMIDEIKADAWRQGAIRVAFVGLLTLAVTAFFFARQNVGLLTSEKDRMQQEVRRLEEEARRKEKLTAMGELAAGVAHEIRNPLNAIGMVSQRLNREFEPRRTEDEAEFRELLDVLRSESARVENVIDQFLRFARPAKAEIVVGDLAQAVQDATKRASAFAASKNVSLIANAPGRCDYAFDPLQMAQVFDNLVRNAIEAQSDGGEVRLRLTSGEDGVTITVADKGQGIPPETLERIFDLYFTTKPNGNGLGLPIVHQIVAEHGGKIDIESEVGQGTTITITLPPTSES